MFFALLFSLNAKALVVGGLWQSCEAKACHGVVTPAFTKTDGKWQSYETKPEEGTKEWTIAFDGKATGTIAKSDLKTGELISEPLVVASSKAISWTRAGGEFEMFDGRLKSRPMIVVSSPNAADPDGWKPVTLNAQEKKLVWSALEKAYAGDFKELKGRAGFSKAKFSKAYASRAGRKIARIELPTPLEGEFEGSTKTLMNWFEVKKEAKPLMPTDLWSASLVDAGDYDADSHSELVFMTSGYNAGGFMLFGDDLSLLATTSFSFH